MKKKAADRWSVRKMVRFTETEWKGLAKEKTRKEEDATFIRRKLGL